MLLILLVAVWIGAGKKRYLVAVSPLIVAVLVCIAGPTFNYQMRYIMPVMFSVPFLAGIICAEYAANCNRRVQRKT